MQDSLILTKVRRWAVDTVKSLGPLDWEDYEELEEVVNWMMTVITFNLFIEPTQDAGSYLTISLCGQKYRGIVHPLLKCIINKKKSYRVDWNQLTV